jgi:hypothetical protein
VILCIINMYEVALASAGLSGWAAKLAIEGSCLEYPVIFLLPTVEYYRGPIGSLPSKHRD